MKRTRTGRPFPYDTVEEMQLADGDLGTDQTLEAMARLARDGSQRPEITAVAAALMNHGPRSPRLYLVRVFNWLKTSVRFKADPPGVELVRHPSQLASEISRFGTALGDCDDRATLGAALLLAAGIPAAFVTIGSNPAGSYEHVYFAARIGDRWIPLDPQEMKLAGQEPDHARRRLFRV